MLLSWNNIKTRQNRSRLTFQRPYPLPVFIFVIMLLLAACARPCRPYTFGPPSGHDPLTTTTLGRLAGRYHNMAAFGDSSGFGSLWHEIDVHRILAHRPTPDSFLNDEVELEIVGNNRLRVRLWHQGATVAESVYNGKLTCGVFVLKKQRKLRGLPPVLWSLMISVVGFGLDPAGNLLMSRGSEGALFITLMPLAGGTTAYWDPLLFNRVKAGE